MSTVAKRVKLGRLLYSFGEEGLVFFAKSNLRTNEFLRFVIQFLSIVLSAK